MQANKRENVMKKGLSAKDSPLEDLNL